jgi:predicted O-methyltransferase YrrM
MTFGTRLRNKVERTLFPLPVKARHIEYSAVSSLDDDLSRPNDRLFDLSLAAIAAARSIDLRQVSMRMSTSPHWPDIWPGEHYKLLAGIVKVVAPNRVVEIGTFTGLSALTLLADLPEGAKLTTVDIVPWQEIRGSCLLESDFADGRMVQVLGDLASPDVFASFAPTLEAAELVFIDGPKDVAFETALIRQMDALRFAHAPIVVFDDIRLLNMLAIWRAIPHPKLDLTSFGHWSGTGIVEWR